MKAEATIDIAVFERGSENLWRTCYRKFLHNGLGMFGAAISLAIGLIALVAPYDPIQVEPDKIFELRSWSHWLGTDELGRDLLSRLIYGARISFFVGLVAVIFKTVIGTTIGLITGYFEGFIDHLLMRCMDVLYAFPRTLLALLILAIVGPSIPALIFVIGLGGIPQFARIVRGAVLSAKQNEYVVAARSLGSTQRAYSEALSVTQCTGADLDSLEPELGAGDYGRGEFELSRSRRRSDAADLGRHVTRRRTVFALASTCSDLSGTAHHVGSAGI